ncbi:hypothetical protein [Diplocloster agilis]|uniref:hypothetical protein n=1 Tax=Diplocloster agilis TaxID=2850323 RepID=UPI000820FA57|nr:hypothetical protein [Suonthocola fibrivorans]MCU6735928.1 hypothetical protein [Suonthocola fibrivorans]SCJ84265.1 Uncharacterised protein [uncultured Clostridium sp.]
MVNGWKKRKERADAQKGYTMIVVMCLMCLFVALSLSILLSATLIVSRANQSFAQEQSRISAITFSEWLKGQLGTDPGESAFCAKINEQLEDPSWLDYDPGTVGHGASETIKKTDAVLQPDDPAFPADEKFGHISTQVYWETSDRSDPDKLHCELVIVVKCEVDDQQYSITGRYEKTYRAVEQGQAVTKDDWLGTWSPSGRE